MRPLLVLEMTVGRDFPFPIFPFSPFPPFRPSFPSCLSSASPVLLPLLPSPDLSFQLPVPLYPAIPLHFKMIVVKFELYELYFWLELYELVQKVQKFNVQKVKVLYYANKLRQKVTTLNNFHVPQSRTLLKCTATLRLIDKLNK